MTVKLAKPENPYTRRKPLRSRASDAEWKTIQAKADQYCGGNVSEWLRLAAVKFSPDLQSDGEYMKLETVSIVGQRTGKQGR